VVTRGAQTDGATSTQANGFFGAALKYSGYDAIVVQGQAKKLCYLYINDDVVEIRDAAHLKGKDTWETQEALEAEHALSGHRLSVYSIGPAGENLVRFATSRRIRRPRRSTDGERFPASPTYTSWASCRSRTTRRT
jgi:aldehyde:ferredoxin oxidoreductase